MTLEQFWAILVKRWSLVVACFLLVGFGAYIGSKLMPPIYESSALVQVAIQLNNNQADYNSLLASDQLVATEVQLTTSDTVLRVVASNYPGLSPQILANMVTASSKQNTQLVEIDVLDTSPTRAAALANDIAATLIKQQLQQTQSANSRSQQQIQQDLDAAQRQIDTTTTQIATLQGQGGNRTQIAVLQTQLSRLQQQSNQWQVALAQLELIQAQNADFLRVAQVAEPNPNPVQPRILLNTGGGLVVGLLLGMLLAALLELLDTRVRTPEALAQLLGWPVLATIWRARSSRKEDVINPTGPDSNVEGYRVLRTNVGFASIDKPLRSLLVTSATPREGKSTISANLAIFMAKAGKTTLLIDADLRHPSQYESFTLSPDKMGMSNAVLALGALTASDVSLEPFVHSVGIPNLWLMPSGPLPPNPPELLDSKAMQRLLAAIAKLEVEVVIIDSAPLLGLSDARILASKVDATLVVVDITRAKKKNLKLMKAMLMQTGANVLGCVVDKQRRSRNDTAYSYYYQADEQVGKESNGGNNGKLSGVPETPAVLENVFHPARSDIAGGGKREPYGNGG